MADFPNDVVIATSWNGSQLVDDYNELKTKVKNNCADGTPPSNPVDGMFWYDSTNKNTWVYFNGDWNQVVIILAGGAKIDSTMLPTATVGGLMGVTHLSSSITSSSETTAATSKAVNDLGVKVSANEAEILKKDPLGGTVNVSRLSGDKIAADHIPTATHTAIGGVKAYMSGSDLHIDF